MYTNGVDTTTKMVNSMVLPNCLSIMYVKAHGHFIVKSTPVRYECGMLHIGMCVTISSYSSHTYVTVSAITMQPCSYTNWNSLYSPACTTAINNYACSLPPLANINWSAFQSAFCWQCKSINSEMVPMEGSKSAVGSWYCCHSYYV